MHEHGMVSVRQIFRPEVAYVSLTDRTIVPHLWFIPLVTLADLFGLLPCHKCGNLASLTA
jgi:hypothetical protein